MDAIKVFPSGGGATEFLLLGIRYELLKSVTANKNLASI
jgi:hypothetical protein